MFDEAVQNTFSSRSEAIRRGMNLVLDELRQYQNQAPAYSLPSANQFDQATTTTIQSGEEKGI
jgi:Arc/MetJ-type ribon-helix-helix transcriptional regulator